MFPAQPVQVEGLPWGPLALPTLEPLAVEQGKPRRCPASLRPAWLQNTGSSTSWDTGQVASLL